MNITIHLAIIIISCVALGKGATWMIDASARIAKHFGLSELVIGLTVVAFGTSAPEFAVTIGSAIKGCPSASVGNVIGSNLFNLGFILGGCALLKPIQISRWLFWRDGLLLLAVTVLLFLPFGDHHLARWEGGLMFFLLVAYVVILIIKREQIDGEASVESSATWRDGPLLLAGLALLILASRFLVNSAVEIATIFGLSQWIIGLTILAIGTSIPELVTSLIALHKGHHGISAGNLIGSSLFNILGVLGVTGLLRPLEVESSALIGVAMLSFLTLLVMITLRTGWKVSRFEGAMLTIVTMAIWIFNLLLSEPPKS